MSNDNQNENTSSENKVPEWSMPLPASEPQNDTAVTLRWYHKTWLICITVWFSVGSLIFGIVALALVWTHPKWVTKTKWIFTAVIAVLLVVGQQIAKQDKIESENAQKLIESAESGDVDAQLKLGLAYLDGGTPKIERNEKDAEIWLKKSADNGNERAMSKLEEIEERKAETERIAVEKEVQDVQKKEGRNKSDSTGEVIKISAERAASQLIDTVMANDVEKCRSLLKTKGILDTPDGKSAFVNAACNGHTECVELLLEAGANPKILVRSDGCTILHLLVNQKYPHLDTIELLLAYGADINAECNELTPLGLATNSDMRDFLKKRGAK